MSAIDEEEPDFSKITRHAPRTFPYREILPYKVESQQEALVHLDHIITNIYICLKSLDKDYSIGSSVPVSVLHWTRELQAWMQLKFDMPLSTSITLARVYYDLALANFDGYPLEKIVNTFVWLTNDQTFSLYVKPKHMKLKVAPLLKLMKSLAGGDEKNKKANSKSFSTLYRLANEARLYFDPDETIDIYREIMPLVCISLFFRPD